MSRSFASTFKAISPDPGWLETGLLYNFQAQRRPRTSEPLDIRRVTSKKEPEAKRDCPLTEDPRSNDHTLPSRASSAHVAAYIQLTPLKALHSIDALVLVEPHELTGVEDDSSMVALACSLSSTA
ncbi:uncharacterized protein ARMOST_14666 [Armillaria ostoyae]|uniref:Uncharacterized protein n=1 Tax=Armillaria ostoyae TaxID=47428 RepID=A0A284RR95_ARMOS|nr:uncharacterized protein ARMOST_14666 [Armillaria ostoyae]